MVQVTLSKPNMIINCVTSIVAGGSVEVVRFGVVPFIVTFVVVPFIVAFVVVAFVVVPFIVAFVVVTLVVTVVVGGIHTYY